MLPTCAKPAGAPCASVVSVEVRGQLLRRRRPSGAVTGDGSGDLAEVPCRTVGGFAVRFL